MNLRITACLFILLSLSKLVNASDINNSKQDLTEQLNVTQSVLQDPSALTDEQRRKMILLEAEKENWSKVFELILPLAQKKDRESQVNLALLYLKGNGVKKDLAKAYWWLSEAAESGSVKALNNLALFYLEGHYVQKNVAHSAKLFKMSAQSGSVEAMFILGQIYEQELKQPQKSFKWFKKAAEAGNSSAKYRLALMYEFGEGTKKNIPQAIYWYQELIAEKGPWAEESQTRLNKLSK
ncbi:sel1 repeat family protein [[Haemophilus] felis]|nr:sel1 repeat family protein [[Haemophilus] felis]